MQATSGQQFIEYLDTVGVELQRNVETSGSTVGETDQCALIESVFQELYAVLDDQRSRLCKIRDKCKEQIDKKIDDPALRNVASLLQKGINWLARQQTEFISHLRLTLDDQVADCEAQFKAETNPSIATLHHVDSVLIRL